MLSAATSERYQRWFFALLSDPRPLAAALEAAAAADPAVLPLQTWLGARIGASNEADAVRRLEIYRSMRFSRLLESLEQDFPSARAALGATDFEALARAYADVHPSRSPTLRDFGAALPGFLRAHWLPRANGDARADLADLCALDWARLDVFDRADCTVLERDALSAIAPQVWSETPVALVPAHAFVHTQHAIEQVWLALDREHVVPAPQAHSEVLLIWKRGFDVRHRALAAGELALLQALAHGMTLAELCQRLALGAGDQPEQVGAHVFARLRQYLGDGLLLQTPEPLPAP